jgi:hypothetical protein
MHVRRQVSAATAVRNFILLSKKWFNRDFSSVLNLVLPLAVPAERLPA